LPRKLYTKYGKKVDGGATGQSTSWKFDPESRRNSTALEFTQ